MLTKTGKKPNFKYSKLAMLVCGTALVNSNALAQTQDQEEPKKQLEIIEVTSQKRPQTLQEVPISVSAVTGEKLAEAGIENLQDLSSYVPNLQVIDGTLSPQIFVRGIGSGENQGFEQSVGTYLDGVYVGRSLQSRSAFMDLERIEILRGPQSILFGQSSIAGALSLVSAKPTYDFEGMISATITPEVGGTEINAFASGGITENLAARLAIRDSKEDGYMDNLIQNIEGPELDEQSARLSLTWDDGDKLAVNFKAEVSRVDRAGRPLFSNNLGAYPLLTTIGTHGPLTQTNTELGFDQWYNADNAMSFDNDSFVLNIEYEIGDHTFTAISAYSEYEYRDLNYDADATEVNVVELDMGEDFDQFSQELRLTSPGDEKIDYIVGLFYQTSEQNYFEDSLLTVSSLGIEVLANPLLPVGILDLLIERDFAQKADTYAAFGQMTWNIEDDLRLNLGLRFTRDEKNGERTQLGFSQFAAGAPLEFVPLGGGVTLADVAANDFNIADHDLRDDYSEDNWVPSVSIQYDWSSDTMVYLSYSEGYKAAGYDARGINGWTIDNSFPGKSGTQLGGESFFFDQEEAETVEFGAKMFFPNIAADLNIAIYKTDYTDMQVSVFDGIFGFAVQNAGEATVQGIEMDGRWQATSNLTLTSSLAYLDFEWTDYQDGACNGAGNLPVSPNSAFNCDYTGQENTYTPEWTVNLSAIHLYEIGDFELKSTLDVNFKAEHLVSADLDPRTAVPSMALVNARVALLPLDGNWQVALVGKNLTDRVFTNNAGSLPLSQGGTFVSMARPRTIGVELQYDFY